MQYTHYNKSFLYLHALIYQLIMTNARPRRLKRILSDEYQDRALC